MRILILRLSSLGDIVLTEPLIRALRAKYPDATIDFVVRQEYAPIVHAFEGLSHVIELDTGLGRQGLEQLRSKLRENKYDDVLDLHNNFRTRALRKGICKQTHVINKRTIQRWLLVKWKVNLLKNAPDIIGRYFETAQSLVEAAPKASPRLSIGRSPSPNAKIAALAPGARHWNKQWPLEYFIELAQSLVKQDYTIHLHGSNEDETICSLIEKTLEPALVMNFAGKLSLVEVAKELSNASFAITNDSGLMHVASAVGTPVVSIFGPTVREFGFMPRAENAVVLENVGLYCRPCTAIGREDCPEGHFRCMREITTEKVIAAIDGSRRF